MTVALAVFFTVVSIAMLVNAYEDRNYFSGLYGLLIGAIAITIWVSA